MSKKRHVLPVLVGIGATALGGCDKKAPAPETDGPREQPTTSNTTPKPKPTTIIHDGDPIRPRLGGVVKRVPPQPPPSPPAAPQVRVAPKASKGAAKGRAAVAAEAATSSTADPRVAVAIMHDHPPGQPCAPLTQQEVRKALDDLRTTKQ